MASPAVGLELGGLEERLLVLVAEVNQDLCLIALTANPVADHGADRRDGPLTN